MKDMKMKKVNYGVLLVNLGTPEAPTTKAVKKYIGAFLSDMRVVNMPRMLWLPLLYGIILPIRAQRVAKNYQSIWMEEGSPLMVYSILQQQALAACLPDVTVEFAMNYGKPELSQAIERLINQKKVSRMVILPLYPQYSCATSAAIWDAVARILTSYRRLPSIVFIRDYAEHPAYIAALQHSIKIAFNQHGKPDRLVISFHGIPKSFDSDGDDYLQRCEDTKRALAAKINYPVKKIMMTFQSRFGCNTWLRPATDETIKALPSQGIRNVQLICPGFSSDCLETLYEIKIKNRKNFEDAGGKKFHYIPSLNANFSHVELLRQLITSELK